MKRLFLAAGVAALAMSMPATAERGGGKGNGKGGQSAKVERGGGGQGRAAKANRGGGERQKARGGREARADKAQRQSRRAEQRQRGARADRQAEQRADRSQRRSEQRADRGQRQAEHRAERGRQFRSDQERDRRQARNDVREFRDGERRFAERLYDRDFDTRFDRGFVAGAIPASIVGDCTPGLAKQNALCMPPGQYKKLVGERLPAEYRSHALPSGLRDYYRDTDDYYWRYGDRYLYRVDRDDQLVRSILPLIGAGLGIGMPFPYSSPDYYVPSRYQSFYPDSPYSYYRYANGYVYEIDRDTGMIEDMVPLLDQGYGVGQMLPASYSYYNLPDPYRSYYSDNDDYYYRYAPGAIYQVDRDSQLITSVVSLLMGGNNALAVGQPLPMGYDMYNVPLGYRDQYYDTPDSWYRYSNGNIYQVDPTTRLITAIVDAIV